MPTASQRQAMIASIRQLPAEVEAAVRGLSDGQLDTSEGEGEWTIRQVVHHLADAHMNGFIRTKLILTEARPTLKPYDQDAWAKLPDTTEAPVEDSLSILRGLHERWSDLLESVQDRDWQRSAFHPEVGEVTLEDILATFAGHGDNHVEQILRIRASQGW